MTPIWDCHTDVLSELLAQPLEGFVTGRGDGPRRHYDLERIARGGVGVLVCALFTRDDAGGEHAVVRTLRMIDAARRLEEVTGGRVEVATGAAAIDRIVAGGRTALVLSIENGIACLDRIELLRTYHRLGVRAMGLTWNGRNFLADGCGVEEAGSRLTPFGRIVVDEMQRLGMVVDVSHLSEPCFWDLLERTRGPLIASHSNARWVCDHRRNLTRDQVRAIAARGGVIGLNFYPPFLRADGGDADLDDLARHAAALLEEAGPDHVGIGSDYDGIDRVPRGAEDPGALPALRARLAADGLGDEALDKLFYGNFRRVFGEVMG